MKPVLIIGMGNPLMGDDGIGWKIAELLAEDPDLPEDIDVVCGGTDLLRWEDQMQGCRQVIVVDAILGDQALGAVEVFEDRFEQLENRQWNVHHLSTPQAIGLLRSASPALREIPFTLIAPTIASAKLRSGISPELSARVPEILDLVLRSVR